MRWSSFLCFTKISPVWKNLQLSPNRKFHTTANMSSSSASAILYSAVISPSQGIYAVPEDADGRAHHLKQGKGFTNPWNSYRERSGWQIMKALLWRHLTRKANVPDTTPPTVPVQRPSFLSTRHTPDLRATWLGHACFYVEFPGGFRVLFDPVFTPRCSPLSWLGPKRYTEMPCTIADIPFVDIVVISHNHYDHLSHPTVMEIIRRNPNAQFFVPLGNKQWFLDVGIHNVTELDWWKSRHVKLSSSGSAAAGDSKDHLMAVRPDESGSDDDILATIGCLPCQHTSARTAFDKAQTLWASWSVESGDRKVWFGGDTGYRAVDEVPSGDDDYDPKYKFPSCPAFKQIGDLRGPFDLGLIPIGAYQPRWIMSPMHANPFDSVNIFVDTKCRKALGIHWGTWVLTEEDVLEPPRLLKEALSRKDLPTTGVFDTCDIGESREFSKKEALG